MKIILFERLGVAAICERSVATQNYVIPVTIEDADKHPLAAEIMINNRVYNVNGHAEINPGCEPFIEYAVTVVYKGKRYLAGAIEVIKDSLIVTHRTEDYTVNVLLAAEEALNVAKAMDKRLTALEKAYNGVDILNLT